MAYTLAYRLGYPSAGFSPGQVCTVTDEEFATLRKSDAVMHLIERGYLTVQHIPADPAPAPDESDVGGMSAKDAVHMIQGIALDESAWAALLEAKRQEMERSGTPRQSVLRAIELAMGRLSDGD